MREQHRWGKTLLHERPYFVRRRGLGQVGSHGKGSGPVQVAQIQRYYEHGTTTLAHCCASGGAWYVLRNPKPTSTGMRILSKIKSGHLRKSAPHCAWMSASASYPLAASSTCSATPNRTNNWRCKNRVVGSSPTSKRQRKASMAGNPCQHEGPTLGRIASRRIRWESNGGSEVSTGFARSGEAVRSS